MQCQMKNDDGSPCYREAIVQRTFAPGCFGYCCDLHRREPVQHRLQADPPSALPNMIISQDGHVQVDFDANSSAGS